MNGLHTIIIKECHKLGLSRLLKISKKVWSEEHDVKN